MRITRDSNFDINNALTVNSKVNAKGSQDFVVYFYNIVRVWLSWSVGQEQNQSWYAS